MVNKEPTAISAEIAKIQSSKNPPPYNEIKDFIYNKYDYHPDWNAFKAFGVYISKIFKGDFGYYYQNNAIPIQEQFSKPLKYTFLVSGIGFVFGTILGLIFGIIAGYKRGKWPDIVLNVFTILFVAIPSFILASILVLLINKTSWPTQFLSPKQAGGEWEMMKTLLLPIIIVTVTSFATITYYVRNEVVEVLKSDYVLTARAKGLRESTIFIKHVLKNISIPAVTIILPRFVFIMTGSMIIEIFFGVPGTAHIFGLAVVYYEYNVIMFSVIFFSGLSLIINIVVDVIYTLLDPRIKIASKSNFTLWKRIKNIRKRIKNSST
ncbi:ABC transporter permease [Mycoplasma marinum]|uniref:Peptide ABC transporter permease n=1 Tax=Mycoplasma marinum TaxID=1937190 RepID=A0A4R0XNI6_9MOLU|nr:ABC transporter permease [Mycoplasma marinum]TCG11052.1 peptide ABC transporter permease [Mycoplasma marinum]